MSNLNINSIQDYLIPFESQLWDLLLNDPYFKQIEPEMKQFHNKEFTDINPFIINCQRQVNSRAKEVRLVNDLCTKLNLKRDISIFTFRASASNNAVVSYHSQIYSQIYIAKSLTKVLLEQELSPILAFQLAYLLIKIPIPVPEFYLYLKLKKSDNQHEQYNILRLLYLCNYLYTFYHYNLERVSILATGFEPTLNAYLQMRRVNSKRNQFFPIESIFKEFPYLLVHNRDKLVQDYQMPNYRLFAMYLFAKDHKLIQSYSLSKINPKVTWFDIFNIETITDNYIKMLKQDTSQGLYYQLYNEYISEDVLDLETKYAHYPNS